MNTFIIFKNVIRYYSITMKSIQPKNKDFLNTIGEIMDDVTFKDFFDTYFNDWDECIAAVMMMKAYQTLSVQNPDASSHEKVEVLRSYMKNAEFRHRLANSMFTFMKQHNTLSNDHLFLPNK